MQDDQLLQTRENAEQVLFPVCMVKYHIINKENKLSVFIFYDLYPLHDLPFSFNIIIAEFLPACNAEQNKKTLVFDSFSLFIYVFRYKSTE